MFISEFNENGRVWADTHRGSGVTLPGPELSEVVYSEPGTGGRPDVRGAGLQRSSKVRLAPARVPTRQTRVPAPQEFSCQRAVAVDGCGLRLRAVQRRRDWDSERTQGPSERGPESSKGEGGGAGA